MAKVLDRFEDLKPYVENTFHTRIMAQMVLGRYWEKTNTEEKRAFVKSFLRYNTAFLAALLSSYDGQIFKFKGVTSGPQGTIIVKTQLIDLEGTQVKISYILKDFENDWRAIDVILDNGISELKIRKSEYRAILSTYGISFLIRTLNEKVNNLLNIE